MKNLDFEEALELTLQFNESRGVPRNGPQKSVLQQFNIETYKMLFDSYQAAPKMTFRQVRSKHYSSNVRPYFDGLNYFCDYELSIKHYENLVGNLIQSFCPNPKCIIDIGAGSGDLIRYLSKIFPIKCIAIENSHFALSIISQVNLRENFSIETQFGDFNKENFTVPENSFVFSSYSLMYSGTNLNLFSEILASNPHSGIFIEPIFEDQQNDFLSELIRSYMIHNKYSTDWFSRFKQACETYGYKIVLHQKNVLAHNLMLPVSIIGWRK